jgi:hypothetical protein
VDQAVVLTRVGWNTYEGLLADNPGRIRPLLSCNRGKLEIVSPSPEREQDGDRLKFIVVSVSAALAIPVARSGATTYRRPDLQRPAASSTSGTNRECAVDDRSTPWSTRRRTS